MDSVLRRHPHAIHVSQSCPYRLPRRETFDQSITTILKQQRLDIDPLAAIEHLATINPSLFLHFSHSGSISEPDIPSEHKEPISCIISPPHALDNAIMYGFVNGIYMDSSWRNKNAHRAPMTVLATHDDLHRMVPIAVMISQHGGKTQYHHFLSTVKQAIETRSGEINSNTVQPSKVGELGDRLREYAQDIVMDDFTPPFVMIDGCDAERAAIDRVWPNIYKRVCQFHLMQAIRGHCRSVFGASPRGELKTTAILDAIRELQRCPDEDKWESHWVELGQKVNGIANDDGETWESFSAYLLKHWFSSRWRKYCVDFGLPHTTFASGPWSTNNYVESTFRVFDRVLLSGRSNKR